MAEHIPPPLPDWSNDGGRRILVLSSSPRTDGNSQRLAGALADAANAADHDALMVNLNDHVTHMLRDCRKCRSADTGRCSITDNHGALFSGLYLSADAVVYATPIWWYGISAQLKAFIDRIFCFISNSEPTQADVLERLPDKRAALILSAEESNFAARLAIVQHMSELCRYLHHDFVGVVTGIGNKRGDVNADPADPLEAARQLGARMFDIAQTDYKLDTERGASVWEDPPGELPAMWR